MTYLKKIKSRIKKQSKPKKIFMTLGLVAFMVVALFISMFGLGRLKASDCTSFERYDSFRGECYFDCDTDKQCDEISAKVDAELNSFFEGSTAKIQKTPKPDAVQAASVPTPSPSSAPAQETKPTPVVTTASQPKSTNTQKNAVPARVITKDYTGSETSGIIYTVNGDQELYPAPSAQDQELWRLFTKVAGKQTIAERLESFEVFTDGSNDSAASVWESDTPGKWHMNVNASFKDDKKDLIHTMVHEFGHIVTLNSSQVEKTSGACPRLSVPEGCAKAGTVLNDFYTEFWSKYGSNSPSQETSAPYSDDAFVTEYAASNGIEDLAETFAFFVLRPKPTGSIEKDLKVQNLYTYPELIQLRNSIRSNPAAEI